MRYTGQGWEIPSDLTEDQAMNPNASTFKARFEEDYAKLFGRAVDGMDIEITVWSVHATTPPEKVPQASGIASSKPAEIKGRRQIFDPASGEFHDAGIADRAELGEGDRVEGPAAIVEDETTIIVPASRDAIALSDGCIDVVMKG